MISKKNASTDSDEIAKLERSIEKKKGLLNPTYKDMNFEELDLEAHDYKFVGKVGLFCPMKPGHGGELLREQVKSDGTMGMNAVVGTDGYLWMESEDVEREHLEEYINVDYYEKLVQDARDNISQYGDYEWFVSDDPYQAPVYINGAPDYTVGVPF